MAFEIFGIQKPHFSSLHLLKTVADPGLPPEKESSELLLKMILFSENLNPRWLNQAGMS